MPRLAPKVLHHAHRISPHVRTLLPVCRDVESAQNELRWVREHVASTSTGRNQPGQLRHEPQVAHLCARRGRGEPLQHVLGSQPFGGLELRCRRDVLIPRVETEAYVVHLAGLIRGRRAFPGLVGEGGLRVLDLCAGTGCISLLLYEQLYRVVPGTRVTGLDVSPAAVSLARENLRRNVESGSLPGRTMCEGAVRFGRADIFSDEFLHRRHAPGGAVDVLVSNPPYISSRGFDCDTGRSVRNFEPKLALVPDEKLRATAESLGCELEDVFYARLFDVAARLQARIMLFEVGDMKQARRVAEMATRLGGPDEFACEIWRDEPDVGGSEQSTTGSKGRQLTIKGEGHGRSVLIYRKAE